MIDIDNTVQKFESFVDNMTQGQVQMPLVEKWLHQNIPQFGFKTASIVFVMSIFVWICLFFVLHFLMVLPIMNSATVRKNFPAVKYFHDLSIKEQYFYTGYIHGIIHALLSCIRGLFCLVYADGVEGTTWFNSNYYQLHMFDIQKYFNLISASWMAYDFVFFLIT